ncbi:hypothetical protein C8Q80DRAFT_266578 [Daedaleopsis nitida]|nr:hypothetical protein C8Q80DRAFT_266578 [Daedaleopsis nitida]
MPYTHIVSSRVTACALVFSCNLGRSLVVVERSARKQDLRTRSGHTDGSRYSLTEDEDEDEDRPRGVVLAQCRLWVCGLLPLARLPSSVFRLLSSACRRPIEFEACSDSTNLLSTLPSSSGVRVRATRRLSTRDCCQIFLSLCRSTPPSHHVPGCQDVGVATEPVDGVCTMVRARRVDRTQMSDAGSQPHRGPCRAPSPSLLSGNLLLVFPEDVPQVESPGGGTRAPCTHAMHIAHRSRSIEFHCGPRRRRDGRDAAQSRARLAWPSYGQHWR